LAGVIAHETDDSRKRNLFLINYSRTAEIIGTDCRDHGFDVNVDRTLSGTPGIAFLNALVLKVTELFLFHIILPSGGFRF
jgi:hypothetical protein